MLYNDRMLATLILPIILGLLIGLGVNYLSDVLPVMHRLSRPTCPRCGAPYAWAVYLLLKPCAQCGAARHWRAAVVMLVITVMSVYIWLNPQLRYGIGWGLVLLAYFGVVTVIDLEHRLILHPVSLVGLGLGLAAGSLTRGWQDTLLGAAAGLGIMMVFYLFGALFARWRAKRMGSDDGEEALGFGDVALATVLGAWLGWPLIWFGLLLGILLSGVFILLLMLGLLVTGKYKTLSVYVAYGPYLVLSAVILLYFPFLLNGLGYR